MSVFTVRRMTGEDKPAVLELSSRIWEGRDYLPRVFDAWVADTDGEFAAVLLDGRVVGCGKLTYFTPVDAWLEGLRKDPSVTEKGLGRFLALHFFERLAVRPGLATVRFSTRSRNLASITANERLGFQRRMTLTRMSWQGGRKELASVPLKGATAASPRVVTVSDESLVFDFLVRYGCFRDTAGLVVDGWQARPFSSDLLAARYIRPGCCRGIMSEEGLCGLVISRFDDRFSNPRLKIICLDARDTAAADALFDDLFLRVRAAEADGCDIEWMVPAVDRLKKWCAARGLQAEGEDDVVIFELPLTALLNPPAAAP
jgi:RimJ/RimL family protein N-acetyltransferase